MTLFFMVSAPFCEVRVRVNRVFPEGRLWSINNIRGRFTKKNCTTCGIGRVRDEGEKCYSLLEVLPGMVSVGKKHGEAPGKLY
jgi:hypothetical protein